MTARRLLTGARWYDALTGRWLSADIIVPGAGNPQSLNRHTHVNNSYTYDRAGNVRSITDGHVVTPTVEFLYDSLSRLVIARGGYFGHYAYDAIGNIAARDGSVYTYTNEQPHAVRQVIGSGAPITRTVTLMARAEGGDTTVTLEVNGSTRGAWNVISATQYATYTLEVALTGHDVFELWFDDGGGTRTLYVDRVEVQRVDLPPLTDPLSHRLYMAAILRNTEGEGDGGMGLGLGAPVVHVQGGGGPVAVLEAEGGAMLYGHGDVEEAFQPGHVTPGQEELTQSGALRFVVGERAYAAAYDGNGNMASRATEAGAQVLTWDAENRLVGYQSSVSSASYAYDGDGVRVRTVITDSGGVTTTVHIGGTYEWVNGSAARSYYYQGSQRVAMREGGELYFLLGDHLGSTSVSYRVSDGQTVTQTYHAWGDIRPGPANALPTDYAFTGQRLQSETGLYQMGARWYDALTGRWLSADTIVPGAGNPQSLNRYSYCLNNPLAYVDPSGHWLETAWDIACIAWDIYEIKRNPSAWNIGALVLDVALAIVPFLPGGIGLLAKGGKVASHADEVVDAVRLVDAVDDATDVARAAGHVDDAADAARAAGEAAGPIGAIDDVGDAARAAERPPVVIGENMTRVRQYAERTGGHAYRPWRNDPFDAGVAMQRNERWIKEQMSQGRRIIDIGPDFARRAAEGRVSAFYEMERRMIREWQYGAHLRVFKRYGAFGGVPGLDF